MGNYTKLVPRARNDYNVDAAYRRSLRRDLVKRLGGKCNRCGSTENLHIDHAHRDQKRTSDFAYLEAFTLMAELKNCQLLCQTCHGIKGREHGDYRALQCGTYRKYIDKGCRCAACYTAFERHKHNDAKRVSGLKSSVPERPRSKGGARRKGGIAYEQYMSHPKNARRAKIEEKRNPPVE